MKRGKTDSVAYARHKSIALLLVALLGGCGGGGGSGSAAPGQSPTGSLVVTVQDPLGEPLAHAHVEVWSMSSVKISKGNTDSSGRVRFARVPAGTVYVQAFAPAELVRGVTFSGNAGQLQILNGGALEVGVRVGPEGGPFAALRAPWVAASQPDADGRALDVTVDVYSFGAESSIGAVQALYLDPCEPDSSDDTPAFRSNCVEGTNFDAPYDAPGYTTPLSGASIPGGTATPFWAALLLDQGRSIALNDSEDARLFAIKYFLSSLQADDHIQLSAFASDAIGGSRALLPDTPVTLLPKGATATFKPGGSELFPLVDSLASQEGGASPLYTALDRMIEFTAQNTPPGSRRAVVVLTTETDRTCGTDMQCLTVRQALLNKARAAGVSIIVVGIGSQSEPVDVVALSELAVGTSGALLWTNDPAQLPTIFHGLIEILNGSASTFEAHYRIQSPTAGAFQSGRTVLGKALVEFNYCPWDCYGAEVPFAAQIP
jgi:hypothetical protein